MADGGSTAVTRLAFNLYNNETPTVALYEDEVERLAECRGYSVSDIFALGATYVDYFVEAIKMRYPPYVKEIP